MSWFLGAILLATVGAGPEIEVVRPVPDRIGTEDVLEFSVDVRSGDAGTDPLSFQVFSNTAPSDKLREAKGVSLEVLVEPGSWRSVPLRANYGWFGEVDIGPLGRAEARTFGVRVRSTEETGRIPVEVRLAAGSEVVATDGFRVEIVRGAVLPRSYFSGWLFGLGAAIGILIVVAALVVRRRRRL